MSRNESSLYIYLSLHIYLIIAHLFVQIWIISVLSYISTMLHTFLTNLLKNAPHFLWPPRDVQLVDSIFPMLRSIGVLMASTSHAPYSLSLQQCALLSGTSWNISPAVLLLFWDWIVGGAVCPNVADVSAH